MAKIRLHIGVTATAVLGTVLLPLHAVHAQADSSSRSAAPLTALVREGITEGSPVALQGYNSSAVIASAWRLKPVEGADWQDASKEPRATLGTYTATIRGCAPTASGLADVIPAAGAGRKVSSRQVLWNGVTGWMIDVKPDASAAASPDANRTRARVLLAPVGDELVALTLTGPDADFEALREQLRSLALSVRFRIKGLLAEYYSSEQLDRLARIQTDPRIQFDWAEGGPGDGVGPDDFSIRWTGRLRVPESGRYTLTTVTDDGVRLWLDNRLLIDNWTEHAATEDSAGVELEAGRDHDIRMEWFERGGLAVAQLFWTPPGGGQRPVPADALSAEPAIGFALPPGAGAEGGPAGHVLPDLLGGRTAGGYRAAAPEHHEWQGRQPHQHVAIGDGDQAVRVQLRRLTLRRSAAHRVLPPENDTRDVDITPIVWQNASAWKVVLTLHPDKGEPLYCRYYLVPISGGIMALSFESRDPDWLQNNQDAFLDVFDSVKLTSDVQDIEGISLSAGVF